MKPSANAWQLIKNREQCKLTSYRLKKADGSFEKHYTIGWGHYCDRTPSLDRAGARITQAQADAFLVQDMQEKVNAIKSKLKVSVTQNVFDALVSTVYQFNPNGDKLKPLFRAINLGYATEQIAKLIASVPSVGFNVKARKVDSHLALTGKVLNIKTV